MRTTRLGAATRTDERFVEARDLVVAVSCAFADNVYRVHKPLATMPAVAAKLSDATGRCTNWSGC